MKNNLHYRTEIWEGRIEYGNFRANNWFSIGGFRHPLFRAICRDLAHQFTRGIVDLSNHEVFVCGGLLEPWMSWDIDMVVIGEPNNDAKRLMYELKRLGFLYHLYIDVNLQQDLQGINLNCGGLSSWDQKKFTYDAFEIANKWGRSELDGSNQVTEVYDWQPMPNGLYKRRITYPFDKNLSKFRQDGYIYHTPIKLKDFLK